MNAIAETKEALWRAVNPCRLHLTILPTEACNFSCAYCYESHVAGRMSPVVVDAIKLHITRRAPELEELELSWFGGEPLLAVGIIEDICSHSQALAKEFGFSFTSNVTTNGYLLNAEVHARLNAVGVTGFQISLDGPADFHNQSRQQRGGKPSFDKIWDNLVSMSRSVYEFTTIIRIHYSPQNIHLIDILIASIDKEFASDSRFKVYFKAISHLGSKQDQKITVFDNTEAALIKNSLDSALQTTTRLLPVVDSKNSPYICYAAALNAFVVRADGRIAKCTVDLYSDKGVVGVVMADGSLKIDSFKVAEWTMAASKLTLLKLQSGHRGSKISIFRNYPAQTL